MKDLIDTISAGFFADPFAAFVFVMASAIGLNSVYWVWLIGHFQREMFYPEKTKAKRSWFNLVLLPSRWVQHKRSA